MIAWPLGSDAFRDSLPWVWAAGGDFISLSRQVLIDSERTQEALCRLARLILTDCAPLPPDRLIDSLIELRTQFMVGGFGIVAGSLWITQTPDWQSRFKTTLHPPDLFPATFIGGSNLAIVRKYGDNENAETYQLAKKFLELAVNAENQIRLARVIGKLPCNIAAWEQMKQEEKDENGKAALDMFDKALCHTVDRGMPNLLNFAQIEEELKNSVATIWANVGEIKRASPEASLETLETECRVMIHRELTKARQQIEKFLTGYTVQYTRQEVEEIGIIPPGQFDLWLEVTSNTPTVKGKVYVTARGEIQTGIGPKLFGVLYALTNAPQRTLSQEKLLEDFWEYKPALHSKCIEIISLKRQLSLLARLIRKSWQLNQNQLLNELQQHSNELPYSTLISKMEKRRKWGPHFSIDYFRDLACEIIASLCEEIETIADKLDPKPKIEDLRKTYENLNKYLGEIKGRPVINRLRPDHYDLYLDSNLSICLVVL
ncbi:MAG: hypothetical protein HYR94_29245 [Chloroflexi bacterium]|nr:hypothetical protein [Chloroflexota bacterium]